LHTDLRSTSRRSSRRCAGAQGAILVVVAGLRHRSRCTIGHPSHRYRRPLAKRASQPSDCVGADPCGATPLAQEHGALFAAEGRDRPREALACLTTQRCTGRHSACRSRRGPVATVASQRNPHRASAGRLGHASRAGSRSPRATCRRVRRGEVAGHAAIASVASDRALREP
jgi:hypothetical protein